MTDKADLKNMVSSFRVSELQLLLGVANQSKCGRKTELLQRALQLVEKGVSSQIQQRIKELYQKYTQRLGYTSYLMNHKQISAPNGVHSNASESPMNGVNTNNSTSPTPPTSNNNNNNNVHPEVKLKQLPFYDNLSEIMKPVSLVPRLNARQQECRFNFSLTDQQVKDITNSRENTVGSGQVEFLTQLQMRFCLVDTSCRQSDCFPSGICVKVNGALAPLPNLIPTNKPGAEPKRPNRPVDITKLCRLSSSINNTLSITWNVEENKSHCVCINLVRKLNSHILLQRLKRNGICKPETTKTLIREKLSLDKDNEIATTSLRVSLLCPLGKMRMTLPCRATSCSHLQCYDALTFLQMNEKKPTWACPVCDRPSDFSKLIIDGLFVDVLREASDSMEVELMRDGSWSITKSEEAEEARPPTPDPAASVDVQNISEEDVIDLTETDDEADVRPHRTNHSDEFTHQSQVGDLAADNSRSRTSSPQLVSNSSNSPTVYDLSPVHIPLVNTPPTPISNSPILQPPMAHQNRVPAQSFKASSKFSSSSSSSMSPFNLVTSYSSSSTPIFPPLGFDNIIPNEAAMMEFLTMMTPLTDFQTSRPNFEYIYPSSSSVRSSVSEGMLTFDKETGSTSPSSGRS